MATQIFRKISYGLSEPLIDNGQGPIIAKRDPANNDKALVGTEWVNTNDNTAFFLTSVVDNVATWVPIVNSGTSPIFDADSGVATPLADVIRISGSGISSTSASGNTVIINTPVTNFVTSAGTATPSSSTLNVIGGTGVATTGSGSTVTISLSGGAPVDSVTGGNNITITGTSTAPIVNVSGTTNHAVQIGNATNSLSSVAVGATNTVLLGNTGADPSFGSVPNAALSNSSITLSNGQNVTVTGSPVSLGGTATIGLSGVVPIANGGTNASSMATTDGVVYFDGTRLVTTAVGTATNVLTSNGAGVAPTFQAVPGSGGATTFHTNSADATTAANAITVSGGNNITTSGSGSTVTVNVSGTTNHGVQLGNSTGSLNSTAVGTNGQLLVGTSATDPTWVTPTAGTGLSITTNATTLSYSLSTPVSIANGGTNATSMTTTDGVVYFDGTRLVTTTVGTATQVLTSNGAGVAPTFQASPSSSITLTGDSGGALTGNSFTLTGGTSGLTFAGVGSTETLGGTLNVAHGGTGVATIAAHSLIIGEGTSAVANTGAGTAGQIIVSGGASADPAWITPTAGTGLSVTTNATTLSYALTAPVSIANGGTNATSMATTDGVVYFDGTRLVTTAVGTATQVLTSNGAGVAPTFQAAGAGGISTINGNSGSVTGSTVTLTTGAANAQGTAKFTGSGTTMTMTFDTSGGGTFNLALGGSALSNGSFAGAGNVCVGSNSGLAMTLGDSNCCFGAQTGKFITSGDDNTILGYGGGGSTGITTGSGNVIIGAAAGDNYQSSESNNILINSSGTLAESNTLRVGSGTGSSGSQLNKAFISGIQGITVTGTAVLVSSSDQLGIAVSSQRFKNDIQPMGDSSNVVYKLRPVTFTWDRDSAPGLKDASTDRQCGLIAEEVAQVFPQVVGFEKDGKPLNVNYGDLTSLLVNEIQKLNARITALEAK